MSIRKILFLAVAGLMISPALMAADLDGPSGTVGPGGGRTFGDEFLGTHGGSGLIAADQLRVTLEAEYTVGDIVTLTFTGSALDDDSMPTSAVAVANAAPCGTCNGITMGLLSSSVDQVTYRVTEVTTGTNNTTNGSVVLFAADLVIMFDALDTQSAGGITVSYSAATDTGIPLDTSGGDDRDHDIIIVEDEYELVIAAADDFDAIIEVETERTTFTTTDQFDELKISITQLALAGPMGTPQTGTVLDDVDITYSGNFGWIVDDDLGEVDIQPQTGVVTFPVGAGCGSATVTPATIEISCDGTGDITLRLDVSKNLDAAGELVILPGTSYSVSVDVNYEGIGSGTSLFTESGGSWTLNGFQAFLPYMPYGIDISQVIYVVNRGSQDGAVTVDWVDQNGNAASLGTVANLGPLTTLSLGNIIRNALPATQRQSGRLALTITANVPSADVQINSQYNVSGNRAFVLHEDNRPESNK